MRCCPSRLLLVLIAAFGCAAARAAAPVVGGCRLLPADNPWNTRIDTAAVDPRSAVYIENIDAGGGDFLHPDFGSNPAYGIPWTTVDAAQAAVPVHFDVPEESEPGPYPIPADAPVEGGGDRHVLVVDTADCVLYELYAASYSGSDASGWNAYSGAVWPLDSNRLRPDGWTSADAAGLPILPGLARCEEAEAGEIAHALRFTVSRTRKAYRYPASHHASSYTDAAFPPMGLRLRLKASWDTSALDGQAGAIARALKTYGMILADNGSNWFISGETNPGCWNDEDLDRLKAIPGAAFEVVIPPAPPSDFAGDLLANGGFEAGIPASVRPEAWRASGRVARICDQPDAGRRVAAAGQCAVRLSPGTSGLTRIAQTLAAPAPGPLLLRLGARPLGLPAGAALASVIVDYTDASRERFDFLLPAGTARYRTQRFTFAPDPARGIAQLRVQVDLHGADGRLQLDQLALLPAPP